MSVLSQGPIRSGNADGGVITLKSTGDDLTIANLLVTASDYTNPAPADDTPGAKEISSAAFDVDVISVTLLDGDTTTGGTQPFADGTYHYDVQTAVTAGSSATANFGLVEDADGSGTVNASDPKTTVAVTPTAGDDEKLDCGGV